MLKKVLFLLLLTLAFDSFTVSAGSKGRDSVYFAKLNEKFEAGDASVKSSVIDFYIDSIGVTSNEFLRLMSLSATPFDFSRKQKARIFDTAATKYKDTRILTYLNFFKESEYIPAVKQWFEKSDKRGKFLYESTLFEFGDKEIREQWETTMRTCPKEVNKKIPVIIGQYFPVICGRFPDRKLCDLVIDFLIDHQNQYFIIKDYSGKIEYDDVVYYLSFFLVDRVKGFPNAFMFNKFARTNENKTYVAFSRHDKDIIVKWCRMHRRDYEFEE